MLFSKDTKSIVIIAGMENDEVSGLYASQFFDDIDNVLVVGVPYEKENEDVKFIKKKELKLLKVLVKENPKFIFILNENEKSKKVNVEVSKKFKFDIMEDENISKSKKTKEYFLKNIIKETGIPYCYIETPKNMDFAKKISIQKNIIQKVIIQMFSNIYN
jgi:hypothetical protein